MENNNHSDRELVLKVAGKESKALEELYDRYSPILFTLINKIVKDKTVTGEILSDIFVIIWQKIHMYKGELENVYTWMVNLARNKALDFVKRSRNPENMEEYSDEYENENIIPKISPSSEPIDLEKALSMKNHITDSYSKLTDAQQYVLNLAYYQGYNKEEIARELNIPVPTVKSKIGIVLSNLNKNIAAKE